MPSTEAEFWDEDHRYHDLVKQYYRNIEMTHPGSVTSQRMCACLDYYSYCEWAATKVKYYEYRGPSI